MNPVLWLELRIRAREKRLWALAAFFIFALILVVGLNCLAFTFQGDFSPAATGHMVTWSVLYCQAGLLLILAPLAAAGRIAQEREQRTLPALANSTLGHGAVAAGKIVGAWIFVAWLGSLAVPALCAARCWGGPPWPVVAAAFLFNLAAGIVLATLAVGLSGLFARSLSAYMAVGALLFGWIALCPGAGALAAALCGQIKSDATREAAQAAIAHLTVYHNPLAPLIALSSHASGASFFRLLEPLGSALAVWVLLGAFGYWLAFRGLQREIL